MTQVVEVYQHGEHKGTLNTQHVPRDGEAVRIEGRSYRVYDVISDDKGNVRLNVNPHR